MRESADVVVIGGGTTGCSIAWHLARDGRKVHLLERSAIASGASGDSPGIVRQHYADPDLTLLAAEGLRMYRHWKEIVGGDCGFRRTGFLTGVSSLDQESTCEAVQRQRALGVNVEFIAAVELRNWLPDLSTDELAGAVYEPDSGYCDAAATARAFASAAAALGAFIDAPRAALRIRTEGRRVNGVETDRGAIDCPVVVNAAGPWATMLAARCGAPVPIRASRQCVAVVQTTNVDHVVPLPGYSERGRGFYLRPDGGGRYVIGSLRTEDSGPIDPDMNGPALDDAAIERYGSRAGARFSRLHGAIPVTSRSSFFDETPDGNPIVGGDPRIKGLLIAAGLSGHGFKFAPVFGQAIATEIATGCSAFDFQQFNIMRFL